MTFDTEHITDNTGQMTNDSHVSSVSDYLSDFVSVHEQPWPQIEVEESMEDVDFVVQVNGKVREVLKLSLEQAKTQEVAQSRALDTEKVKKHLEGRNYKVVFVPGKLINFVTTESLV